MKNNDKIFGDWINKIVTFSLIVEMEGCCKKNVASILQLCQIVKSAQQHITTTVETGPITSLHFHY